MPGNKIAFTQEIELKTHRSQWFFNPLLLSLYDVLLFNLISPWLWGCNKDLLVSRYRELCGRRHLEVGVGTGYLLDKASPAISLLGLMDLSTTCLEKTEKRLQRYSPKTWQNNILHPLDNVGLKFDTISINYVMHCVAGNYSTKGIAFDHLKSLLNTNGVLFGTSVIRTRHSSLPARGFMYCLNRAGVFNNQQDRCQDLEQALARHFSFSSVIYRSSTALFLATDDESTFRSLEGDCHDYR